ncbi:MAG TPA: hypothetical protein VEF53_03730, partial [Patescibacteria group bacterium]|nr:hypothetical protein [Patescibacteria group bacterium]
LTGEADRPLAEGAVKFVVVANGDDNITDEWGNELEDNISFNLSISSDVTAPTVTEIEVDAQDTIFVYFSEDVLDDDGTSNVGTSNFTVVDEDGEDVDIDYVTYHSDDDDEEYYAEIVFEEDLEGEYSITVENVIDTALEENEISKVTKKFEVVDETAPTLTKIEAIGINGDIEYDEDEEEWVETDDDEVDYIYVTFPEDMATSGAYSVLDKDNYQIFDGTDYIDLGDDDKIVTFQGNDKVKITLDDATLYDVEAGLGEDNDGTGIKLVVGRVADALGNKVSSFYVAVDVTAETSLGITAVETVDEKTIVITIDGELKAVNKSYIKVQHDENGDGDFTDANEVAKALYAIKSWEINDDNDTEITAILPSAYYLYSSSDVALRLTLEADELETVSGTSISSDPFTDIEDGYAPSITDEDDIVRVGAEGSMRFSINFDEELATGDVLALYAQDLVVKNSDGDVLVAGVDYVVVGLEDYDYEADLDGDGTKEDHVMTNGKLVIEIQETSNGKEEGNFKVYSNATIKYIQDVEGNKAEAFTDSVTIEDLYVAPEV